MKKGLSIMVVGCAVLFMSSCKKEVTCECVSKVNGIEMPKVEQVIEDGECSDLNTNSTALGIQNELVCTEK